jgi:hypothetical protein
MTRTYGRSQTLKPVRQIMPSAVYSLEEELHLAIVKLRSLPKQAAVIKRPSGVPVRFTPSRVVPPASGPARAPGFVENAREASGFIAPSGRVDAEIAERLARLRTREPDRGEAEFWSE